MSGIVHFKKTCWSETSISRRKNDNITCKTNHLAVWYERTYCTVWFHCNTLYQQLQSNTNHTWFSIFSVKQITLTFFVTMQHCPEMFSCPKMILDLINSLNRCCALVPHIPLLLNEGSHLRCLLHTQAHSQRWQANNQHLHGSQTPLGTCVQQMQSWKKGMQPYVKLHMRSNHFPDDSCNSCLLHCSINDGITICLPELGTQHGDDIKHQDAYISWMWLHLSQTLNSCWSHKHNRKDPSHLWQLLPGRWVNTRYINSTKKM